LDQKEKEKEKEINDEVVLLENGKI